MSDKLLHRLIWLIGLASLLAASVWGWYHGGFTGAVAAVGLLSIAVLIVAKLISLLLP